MKVILYHGSTHIIQQPIFGFEKKYNDYGLGFYCTENAELAKEWSVDSIQSGYANQYELETDGLNILNLNAQPFCILHWLTLLLKNRYMDIQSSLAFDAKEYLLQNFDFSLQNVDVVIGYRADDSYFSFAQDFFNGTISYRQLNNAMHFGKLGEQFVLISKKAFERIKFISAETADKNVWFPKKECRDFQARHQYFLSEKTKRIRGDLYITTILDEEIRANDARLQ